MAESNNHFIPSDHYTMPVIKEYMENDNVKYHVQHSWSPDLRAWDLAKKAFTRLHERDILFQDMLPFDEVINLMERGSSSGYLWKKLKKPKKGDVINDELELLRCLYDRIKSGENVLTVFQMAPKVEIRSLDKLLNADYSKRKQRTFVVGDVLFYLVGVGLYKCQNDNIMSRCYRSDDWCGVGISIMKGGWDRLANILLSASQTFSGHDETAMEACLQGELYKVIYDLRNSRFSGESKKLADWYTYNLWFGYVVDQDGDVFQKCFQNPSGQFNTLTDNCLGLELKLLYHLAHKAVTVPELINSYTQSCLKIVGDDTIIPDNPRWDGVMQSSQQLGFNTKFEYTNEPLTNCKFLNFGFVYNEHMMQWTFEADYDKLFAGLFYYRKSNSWRLTLARLFAMRMLLFNKPVLYEQVVWYICYILDNHKLDMENEKDIDKILPMESLMGQYLSPTEIGALLFSVE